MSDDSAFRIMSREMAGRLLVAVIILAFACLSGGCATVMDEHQAAPPDWPALERSTEYVGIFALQRECYQYVPLYMKLIGSLAMQCVKIDFRRGTCTRYRPVDETDGDDHEEEHCAGRDHVGESTLRDAWAQYKATLAAEAIAKAVR